MKNPLQSLRFTLAAAVFTWLAAAPAAFAQNGTASYIDFNSTTAGFGTSVGAPTIAESATIWSTSSAGTAATTARPTSTQLTIGSAASDFSGETFSINLDGGGNLNGILFNSTNVNVTLNGSANTHLNSSQTWTVPAGSTLNESQTRHNGLNFNGKVLTLAGSGIINFGTPMGANSAALITESMTNTGTVNFQQTADVNGQSGFTGSYTLTGGAMNFATSQAAAEVFDALISSSVFSINGGTIDNTSGSAQTLVMAAGTFKFGGSFTNIGSSSLSLGNNAVALTASPTITVLANTFTIGGAISGSTFGLTKTGNGTLTLAGISTYTGGTVVNGGALVLTNAGSVSASSVLIISNSTLDMSGVTTPYEVNPIIGLTNSVLVLSIPQVATTNLSTVSLNLGGATNPITITSLPLVTSYPARFHLIKYTTQTGTYNLGISNLPASSPAYVGYLTNVAASGFVDFVLTGGPAPVRTLSWTGTDPGNPNNWDIGSSVNWLDTGNGNVPATYQESPNGDFVTFNDTATGTPNVYVSGTLSPGSLTVSNSSVTYTFSGPGPISGIVGLTKQGPGTLIVDENNAYTGANNISSGVVQLGNNDSVGSLGAGVIANNGTLLFDRSGSSPLVNNISGTGTLIQQGGDTLNIGGTNTAFTGTVLVVSNSTLTAGSTLQLGSSSALGAGTLTIVSNSCVLDLNGFTALGNLVVRGVGPNGQGAIDNTSGTVPPADLGATNITLTGNTTFGTSGDRWDLRSPGGTAGNPATASLICAGGQPFNLTKAGSGGAAGEAGTVAGFFSLVSTTVDTNLANIDVQAGTFQMEGNTTSLGNPTNTITVENGAVFAMYSATNKLNKVVVVNDGGMLLSGNGANTIVGPVVLTNTDGSTTPNCNINVPNGNGFAMTLNGPISGNGILNLGNGTNTLTLTANSSAFNGGVTITAAKLALNGILGGGTNLVNSTATLFGTGTNGGLVDVYGALLPGSSGVVGTFTAGAPGTGAGTPGLTLESGATIVFDLAANNAVGGASNDLVVVNGDLSLNGNTITINALTGGLAVTQPYRLFNYTGNLNLNSLPLTVNPIGHYTFSIDTSTPGQVNLIPAGGPWNGGSTTGNYWTDSANWDSVPLAAGDVLEFNGTARLNNTNDTATDTTYNGITFDGQSGAFILNGNPIIPGGNIVNLSPNTEKVDLELDFGASMTASGQAGTLILGGTNQNTANLTTLTLAGTGILTNLLVSAAPTDTNTISLSATNANWTLVDNSTATPMTAPEQFDILAGTFNFGTAGSAPNLTTTTVNGAPQDHRVGNTAGATTFNMNNGVLTTSARLNTALVTGSTGVVNQVGGTFNLGSQFQGANGGTSNALSIVNLSGGVMNIGGTNALTSQSPFYVASRDGGVLNLLGGALNCGNLDVARNANGNARGAVGAVNLNAGVLTATRVGTAVANSQPGPASTGYNPSAIFNFNGGTLKVNTNTSGSIFFQGSIVAPIIPIITTVKSGGAIIDDSGYAGIFVLEPLQHDSTLSSASDGGLTKKGAGTLILSNTASTYNGSTVIQSGTLALGGTATIAASTNLVLNTGATLDVSGRANTTLSLASGQTLQTITNGTVNGILNAGAGSVVLPGGPGILGVLNVSSNVTLLGTISMDLNRNTTPASDVVNATGASITYGGTLNVTSLAGTLALNDSFTLFNAASYSGTFSATNLPALTSGLAWKWNPANGTLSVTVSVNTTPTNIITSVSGNILTLSWPADHLGWRLLVQTNALSAGLNPNTNAWFTVPGSTGVTNVPVTMDPNQGTVFYRLVYP